MYLKQMLNVLLPSTVPKFFLYFPNFHKIAYDTVIQCSTIYQQCKTSKLFSEAVMILVINPKYTSDRKIILQINIA